MYLCYLKNLREKKEMLKNIVALFLFISLIYAAEEKKLKNKDSGTTQHPMTDFFSNNTNIDEKEASLVVVNTISTIVPSATGQPVVADSTTVDPLKAIKIKSTTPKNINLANLDVIIQAPVAKPGEPLLDGIFVAPDKDSLSIAIGGAVRAMSITVNVKTKIFLGNCFRYYKN